MHLEAARVVELVDVLDEQIFILFELRIVLIVALVIGDLGVLVMDIDERHHTIFECRAPDEILMNTVRVLATFGRRIDFLVRVAHVRFIIVLSVRSLHVYLL